MINKESREVIREKKHLKIRNRFSGTTERLLTTRLVRP